MRSPRRYMGLWCAGRPVSAASVLLPAACALCAGSALGALRAPSAATANLVSSDDPPRQERGLPEEHQRAAERIDPKTRTPVDFVHGVRLDWARGVVEVEAAVVLRQGPLELLACTRGTREHESILVVAARPLHIFQAMGLMGLSPGSPVRYDEDTDKWHPPSGERLRIDVRYPAHDGSRVVPIESWLRNVKGEGKGEVAPLPWVFAGSRVFAGDVFAADVEGTVICVVDFATALIGIGALHSADDADLWLVARTKAIPPVGTRCTLLIRSAEPMPLPVSVGVDGRMRYGDKVVSAAEVAAIVEQKNGPRGDAGGRGVILTRGKGVSATAAREAIGKLVRAGIDRQRIEIRQGPESSADGRVSPPRKNEAPKKPKPDSEVKPPDG
ncbi:MAG: hypothetical protein IID36_00770 [Planctomycetes bacterium]|nr:hypothetical protein [Planctomycetota bacterium]